MGNDFTIAFCVSTRCAMLWFADSSDYALLVKSTFCAKPERKLIIFRWFDRRTYRYGCRVLILNFGLWENLYLLSLHVRTNCICHRKYMIPKIHVLSFFFFFLDTRKRERSCAVCFGLVGMSYAKGAVPVPVWSLRHWHCDRKMPGHEACRVGWRCWLVGFFQSRLRFGKRRKTPIGFLRGRRIPSLEFQENEYPIDYRSYLIV